MCFFVLMGGIEVDSEARLVMLAQGFSWCLKDIIFALQKNEKPSVPRRSRAKTPLCGVFRTWTSCEIRSNGARGIAWAITKAHRKSDVLFVLTGDIDVDSEARLALLAKSFSDVYKTSFLLRKKRKTLRAHAIGGQKHHSVVFLVRGLHAK